MEYIIPAGTYFMICGVMSFEETVNQNKNINEGNKNVEVKE